MNTPSTSTDFGPALGLLALRIWLGVRAILTALEKFAGTRSSDAAILIDGQANSYGLTDAASVKFYALANYQGIPAALQKSFEAEPLLPLWALNLYGLALGPALLVLGVTVLLGIAPRISLFLMAMVYTSLTVGLILIKQDGGVAWLAAHVTLVALALLFSDREKFLLFGKKW